MACIAVLARPTDIQRSAWGVQDNGDDVIINAETGCGKTIAFLAPLLNAMYHQMHPLTLAGSSTPDSADGVEHDSSHIPPARLCRGLVLAPTIELCYQICAQFNELAAPIHVHGCPVHRQVPLQVSSSTRLLVGTASYLANFDLPDIFPGCVSIVVDEADNTIQSDKNVWQVLSQYRRLYGILPFRGMTKPEPDADGTCDLLLPHRDATKRIRKVQCATVFSST